MISQCGINPMFFWTKTPGPHPGHSCGMDCIDVSLLVWKRKFMKFEWIQGSLGVQGIVVGVCGTYQLLISSWTDKEWRFQITFEMALPCHPEQYIWWNKCAQLSPTNPQSQPTLDYSPTSKPHKRRSYTHTSHKSISRGDDANRTGKHVIKVIKWRGPCGNIQKVVPSTSNATNRGSSSMLQMYSCSTCLDSYSCYLYATTPTVIRRKK